MDTILRIVVNIRNNIFQYLTIQTYFVGIKFNSVIL